MEDETMVLKFARSRLFNHILTFLSFFILGFIILIMYWLVKNYEVIHWNIAHFEMQKKEYVIGEPLTFRTAFCKTGNYQANSIYRIEDGVKYVLPQQVTKSAEGCKDFISSSFTTPNIVPGVYKITADITYKVNPLKEISYKMESNEFKIIAK